MAHRKQRDESARHAGALTEGFRIAALLAINKFISSEEEELRFPSSFTSIERRHIHRLARGKGLTSKSQGKEVNRFITVYKRKCSGNDVHAGGLTEDFRIAVLLTINKLISSEEEELRFPSSFTSIERRHIHSLARGKDLKSMSQGKGVNRFITVFKRKCSSKDVLGTEISLSPVSLQVLVNFISEHPLTSKERHELVPLSDKTTPAHGSALNGRNRSRNMGKLNNGASQVPPLPLALHPEIMKERRNLPIFAHKSSIMEAIRSHQVTIVTSETGTGKSTQIPQYIMEEASEIGKPCRIVCAEPRRLVAVSLAERVAMERNEMVGQIVGYQIRLESRVSLKTNLTFCTYGILLRSFMGLESGSVGSLTHVIIDEVHERDKQADFLLIVLKEAMSRQPNLRLILMSATVNVQSYMEYFSDAFNVNVPGRMYPVSEMYLEDILISSRYLTLPGKTKAMSTKKSIKRFEGEHLDNLTEPCALEVSQDDPFLDEHELDQSEEPEEDLDSAILDGFMYGSFDTLMKIIEANTECVNYAHSERKVTPLMAAAGQGDVDVIEKLLSLGADPSKKSANGWTAKEFALKTRQSEALKILESSTTVVSNPVLSTEFSQGDSQQSRSYDDQREELLKHYLNTFNGEGVDHHLVVHTIELVHQSHKGRERDAILVFLPSYEDIMKVNELLPGGSSYAVRILHSQMMSMDHSLVFNEPPLGQRKLVLSTNIAETSVTVPDVVFIIDSGKVKEKSFDALSSVSSLTVSWISKASAEQRKGRAGRCKPGVVIRLYSRNRYSSFLQNQIPEILRTPLLELCLQSKMLAQSPSLPIADYLSKAIDPPSFVVTRHAIQMLKSIEALDSSEGVTELGNHLIDLPIEPQFGKMLLCSILLKCLDPVLTIVCCLSYREPFCLSTQPDIRRLILQSKKMFAGDSNSDHMVLLRAFQAWQGAVAEGSEGQFCISNQISSATMEMITGMRGQILGHLRAQGFVRTKGSGDIRDLNQNSENWAVIKAALTAGAYPRIVKFNKETKRLSYQKKGKVCFHASSVLADSLSSSKTNSKNVNSNLGTDWFIYDEMQKIGNYCMVRGVTAVSPITVALFAGHCRLSSKALQGPGGEQTANVYLDQSSDSEIENQDETKSTSTLRLDDSTCFLGDSAIINLVYEFRQKWSAAFIRKLQNPNKCLHMADEALVKAVVKLLSIEDASIGLTQPYGIGQRPRLLPTESKYYRTQAASQSASNLNETTQFHL